MKVDWIEHKGVKILYSDLSNIRNVNEALEALDLVDKKYNEGPGHVRHLLNVENTATGPDFMDKAKALGKKNSRLAYRDAYVGITSLKAILLKGFLLFIGGSDRAKVFNSVEEAKEWLAG